MILAKKSDNASTNFKAVDSGQWAVGSGSPHSLLARSAEEGLQP
jgi:hypothetical protein